MTDSLSARVYVVVLYGAYITGLKSFSLLFSLVWSGQTMHFYYQISSKEKYIIKEEPRGFWACIFSLCFDKNVIVSEVRRCYGRMVTKLPA